MQSPIKIVRMREMPKKIFRAFIVLSILALLTSCWNYRELDEMGIVSGAALDRSKESKNYLLTVEIINTKGGKDPQIRPSVMCMEGETVFDAVRNIIRKAGKRIYWSHAKVVIISEEIAREGIVDVLDFLNRDAEIRAEIFLVISKEKTAAELLRGKDIVHDTISFHIQDIMESQRSIPKYPVTELWHFLMDLSAEGISPIIPTAIMTFDEDNIVPQITGTAVFKKDKMVGWLDEEESRSLLFLKGQMKGGLVEAVHVTEDTQATLEISKVTHKITPVVNDGSLTMDINLKIDAGIAEVIGKEDVISKEGRQKLVKTSEDAIKKQMEKTLKKIQNEYDSDVLGFGSVVQRKMPDYWKKIKGNWEDIFPGIDTNISVEVEIKHSALTSKPIKVGD